MQLFAAIIWSTPPGMQYGSSTLTHECTAGRSDQSKLTKTSWGVYFVHTQAGSPKDESTTCTSSMQFLLCSKLPAKHHPVSLSICCHHSFDMAGHQYVQFPGSVLVWHYVAALWGIHTALNELFNLVVCSLQGHQFAGSSDCRAI